MDFVYFVMLNIPGQPSIPLCAGVDEEAVLEAGVQEMRRRMVEGGLVEDDEFPDTPGELRRFIGEWYMGIESPGPAVFVTNTLDWAGPLPA